MLLAALGFSVMGGAAKILKGSFGAGQLVFWRNTVGILVLFAGFIAKPPKKQRRKTKTTHLSWNNGNYSIVFITLLHPSSSIRNCNDVQSYFCHIHCHIFFSVI